MFCTFCRCLDEMDMHENSAALGAIHRCPHCGSLGEEGFTPFNPSALTWSSPALSPQPAPTVPRFRIGDHVIAWNNRECVVTGMRWGRSMDLGDGAPVAWGWVLTTAGEGGTREGFESTYVPGGDPPDPGEGTTESVSRDRPPVPEAWYGRRRPEDEGSLPGPYEPIDEETGLRLYQGETFEDFSPLYLHVLWRGRPGEFDETSNDPDRAAIEVVMEEYRSPQRKPSEGFFFGRSRGF